MGWLSVKEPFQFRRKLDLLATAARFEPGTENGAGIYGLTARLEEIEEIGIAAMEDRILALNDGLAEAVRKKGYVIASPWRARERSGILTFKHPLIASEILLRRLNEAGIRASPRNGNIRVSPHYYNSEAEMAETAQTLPV